MTRRVKLILVITALCFSVAMLVWSQVHTIWQTDGTAIMTTALTTSSLEVLGNARVQGVTGTLTSSTNRTTVVDGDKLGQLLFQAPLEDSGGDAAFVGASIHGEADGTFTSTANPTEIVFGTASSGPATEKMRLSSGGNLGIGGDPAFRLHVFDSSGELMRIEATNTGTPPSFIRWVDTGGNTAHIGHNTQSNDNFHVINDTVTGNLVLGTAGTAAITIDNTQDVGMGGDPTVRLHVFDNTGEIFKLESTSSGTPANFIRFADTGGNTAGLGFPSSGNDNFQINNLTAGGSLIIATNNGGLALTIDSNQDATFEQVVKISDILTLEPKVSAPGACFIGDFYVDTSGAACACSTNNVWSNMHATGTCV